MSGPPDPRYLDAYAERFRVGPELYREARPTAPATPREDTPDDRARRLADLERAADQSHADRADARARLGRPRPRAGR